MVQMSDMYFLPVIPLVWLNGIERYHHRMILRFFQGLYEELIQATTRRKIEKSKLRGLDIHFENYDISIKTLEPNK